MNTPLVVVVNIAMRSLVTILAGVLIAIMLIAGVSGCELTETKTPPRATSTVIQEFLHRSPVEGSGPLQVVTSILTFPSGASTGRHVHHGLESGYVLSGEVELVNDDQPPRYFSAGDSFVTFRDSAHIVSNRGAVPSVILVTWTVDTDKPVTEEPDSRLK